MISYTVSQRTREIGIRLALGARQERLQLMFVRTGCVGRHRRRGGLLAAAPLSQLMSALLFEVSPVDPLTYAHRRRLARRRGRRQLRAGATRHPHQPVEALRAE